MFTSVLGAVSGCAYVQYPATPPPGVLTADELRAANLNPLRIRRVFQTRRMLLDTLPVGSIVPYYATYAVLLPENWRYCNGDVVDDSESPLHGQRLPNLIDERFPMGALNQHGTYGGSNAVQIDGAHQHTTLTNSAGDHDHGGSTGSETINARVYEVEEKGEAQVRIVTQGHEHSILADGSHRHTGTTNLAGAHDHGGDKRPKWFGVVYIIKIK